jgi:hypothetical protein
VNVTPELDFELNLDALQMLDGDEAGLMFVQCTVTCGQSCGLTCSVTCQVTGG